MNNPFNPGFGKVPGIYLGRDEDVKTVVDNLGIKESPYQTTLVYGMRGTGKTAFITDISRETAKKKNWITADLVMGTPLLQVLIDAIYTKASGILKKILESMSGISISAFGITIQTAQKSNQYQYQVLLMKILDELKKKNIWVLITIDEVKDSPELREFAAVYQLLIRNEYNVCLLMAGLPENVSELQNDDVLTFLLRAGRIILKPIDLWLIRSSYADVFQNERKISDHLLNEITKMTKGYAYGFQLLGYYLWEKSQDTINDEVIQNALVSYKNDLYRNSYIKIYQGLSKVEKEFLTAMAETGEEEVPFGKIVEGLGKSKGYASMYRMRLLDTQVIEPSRHGYLRFTLPLFNEFLLDAKQLMI